ncbi:MAG: phytoene/squalene synthase family protein [Phycisphaerae bacterium]|nr:phytoene/squalene synthase family protein [Phycisphaerae bacterium]
MTHLATDPALVEAFATCESIVRERARNFWYGLRLTPEPKRSAMYAIYAWMREADDIADAGNQSATKRRANLDRFREDTDRALLGAANASDSTQNAPMWRALAAIAPEYDLDAKDFHDMLAGQLADLDAVRLKSWDELRTQCYRVASTVGLVCVRVWGYSDPSVTERAHQLAIDRGIAFQLTNILRDVREDRANGRVYLPEDELRAAGLDIDSLVAWRDDRRCDEFLRKQIARAQEHYRRSADLESLINAECVPTLWALTRIYRRLLDRIAEDPQAVVGAGRVRVATWEKLWIGFRAKRMAKAAQRGGLRMHGDLAAEIAAP